MRLEPPPGRDDRSGARPGPGLPGLGLNVAVFLVVTMVAAGGLNVLQPFLGIAPDVIQIVQFSPAIGALAVLLLRLRRPERRAALYVSLGISRSSVPPLVLAVVVNLAVLAGALAIYTLTGGELSVTDPATLSAPLALVLVAQFVGASAEEVGWRCYLQPELQGRFGLLPAAVVVGLLWGAWHIHIFAQEPLALAGFLLMTVSTSVILAVLLRPSRTGNLLVSGLFHTLVNVGLLFFLPDAIEHGPQIMSFALPCAAIAVFAAVVDARRPAAPVAAR